MNQHRDVIYGERNKVLAGESMRESVLGMVHDEIEALAREHIENAPADPDAFHLALQAIVPLRSALPIDEVRNRPVEALLEEVGELVGERYEELEDEVGEEAQRQLERFVLLRTIDLLMVQHLTAVAELRQGIGLRAYGQANPLVAYKHEAHDMWEQLLGNIRAAVTRQIFHVRPVAMPRAEPIIPRNALASGAGRPGRGRGRWRRRRRHGDTADARAQGGSQRALPLRLRQEVQALPRGLGMSATQGGSRRGAATAKPSSAVPRESVQVDFAASGSDPADGEAPPPLDAEAGVRTFLEAIKRGEPWYPAMLDVIARWVTPEEQAQGRRLPLPDRRRSLRLAAPRGAPDRRRGQGDPGRRGGGAAVRREAAVRP